MTELASQRLSTSSMSNSGFSLTVTRAFLVAKIETSMKSIPSSMSLAA